MKLLAAYRERVRQRPDSEHAQALLRAVIIWLLLINTAWVTAGDPDVGARLWGINVFSAIFSLLLLAHVLYRPGASPRRRVLGAVHDNVAITAWLYLCGPIGALALFVYPFVTVGNGFRYGVRYLAWSGFMGAVGMATLFAAAPAWTGNVTIGFGILFSHVVVTGYTGTLLRQLRQSQDDLERMARSDTLTGLPNRRYFMDRLSRLVSAPEGGRLACLYLDLDGFKGVNDRLGHKAGDELLHSVATALVGCVRATDFVARLGGDEFTVLLDDISSPADAKTVADRIIHVIEGIDRVAGQPVAVSVSIGISFVEATGGERQPLTDELLRTADEAMYAAKRSGRGRFQLVSLEAGAFTAAA
jgi:diguanylate cyclase (GGDEF)-like protein